MTEIHYLVAGLSVVLLLLSGGAGVYFARSTLYLKRDSRAEMEEMRRMFFAAAVLGGLGALFFEGMILYYFSPGPESAGKEIFDACKTIIPPLIALVVGYFFGSRAQAVQERSDPDDTRRNSDVNSGTRR